MQWRGCFVSWNDHCWHQKRHTSEAYSSHWILSVTWHWVHIEMGLWWQLKTVEVLRKKPWSWTDWLTDWLGGNSQNQNRGNQLFSPLVFERNTRPSGLLPTRIITRSPSILTGCLHTRHVGFALWALWAKDGCGSPLQSSSIQFNIQLSCV